MASDGLGKRQVIPVSSPGSCFPQIAAYLAFRRVTYGSRTGYRGRKALFPEADSSLF